MDLRIEQLHSAARRYCIEQSLRGSEEYAELMKRRGDTARGTYSEEEWKIFPRYHVLDAILEQVEQFTPKSFDSLEEARILLIQAGMVAENIFTLGAKPEIAMQVMLEERKRFEQYLLSLKQEELDGIAPLFYRRVLLQNESEQIWLSLKEKWAINKGDYWYPLSTDKFETVEAFQDTAFEKHVGAIRFRELLKSRNVKMIWELREYGTNYELEASIVEPFYNGAEGYWTSQEMNWIVYASHESSVTVGGWLLEEIKRTWPAWSEYTWTTPFFR